MSSDNPAIRMRITTVKVGIRQRVEGKAYERMDFTATTDKSGMKVIDFLTFSPDVMDAVVSGKPFDADVVVENGQSKVVKVIQLDREISIKAQTAVKAVARELAGGVKVPKRIIDKQQKLIEQWLDEALE